MVAGLLQPTVASVASGLTVLSGFELGKQQQPARLDRSHLHLMSIQAEALLTEALYSVAP
jgi:hypothetical protein